LSALRAESLDFLARVMGMNMKSRDRCQDHIPQASFFPMPHNDPRLNRFPHVCIVEASAGTGKTYALARRYIQLLMGTGGMARPAPFKSMLAITFSNKAALEMKERILDFLKRIALDGFADPAEEKELFEALGVQAGEARPLASRSMDELVRNYNFFQVQTIDSFMNAILSGCAFHLGLSSSFRIRRDWQDFLAFSLDSLIDRAGHDKAVRRLFEEALRQYLYLESRSGWFPKRDMLVLNEELFSAMNRMGRPYRRVKVLPKDLLVKKRAVLQGMKRLRAALPEASHKGFTKSLDSFLETAEGSFDFADVSDFWKRDEMPLVQKAKVPAEARRLWKKVRKDLEAAAVFESILIFRPYVEIFGALLEELRREVAKEDVLFLDELNFRAHEVVGHGAVSLPELYYRLAVRLQHFLVDEFQDTSLLQWSNLHEMVKEALSTGGSLFCVGDKKQAIYRFRGGDVRLFDALRRRFAAFSVVDLTLDKNRRSRSELVHFCNTIFAQENLGRFLSQAVFGRDKGVGPGERQGVLDVFKGARQEVLQEDSGGLVRVEVLAADDREEREVLVRDRLFGVLEEATRQGGYGLDDIAVLVRENKEVELVSEWLLGRRIPVASEKTLNIRNHPRIKEVISLLRFLNKPVDNLAFVSFILGDIFCRASGQEREAMASFVFSRPGRGRKAGEPYLYRSLREQHPALWETYFDGLFKAVGFVPFYELVVRIYAQFRCLELFGSEQGFFMRLLELIKEREEENAALADFLEFFDAAAGEELYLKGLTTAAVSVTTIHKAKGLGFPVVVLPFLGLRPRVDAMAVQETDEGLFLRRVGGKYAGFSPDLDAVAAEEYFRSLVDEMNGVYVGLTRARDAMWVFLPHGAKRAANPLLSFFPEEVRSRGQMPKKEAGRSAGLSPLPVVPIGLPAYGDWVPWLSDEFMDKGLLERRGAVRRGEVLHALLSWVADAADKEAAQLWAQVLERGRPRFPFVADWDDCEKTFVNVLTAERLKPFFRPEEGDVFCEQEIAYRNGDIGRIDRVIVKEKEVWVVDYKSSRQEAQEGAAQVRRYAEAVGRVFAGRKVRGFLIYLDTAQGEEVL